MLNALIDRQDRDIARPAQPPMIVKCVQAAQHLRGAIRVHPHPVDKVGAGQVQIIMADRLAGVIQQVIGFIS